MEKQIVISLTLAVAGSLVTASVAVQAQGMFCQPGQGWTAVDSGTITDQGWNVVNFTKPQGGELRVTWTYQDFDDGPANAGFWYAPYLDVVNAGAGIYTNDRASGIDVHVDTLDVQAEERVAFRHEPSLESYDGTARLVLPASLEKESAHIVQYAAGHDSDGWTLSWELSRDECLEEDPSVGVSSGTDAHLLTAQDLRGDLAVTASTGATTATGPDGAKAFVNATATRTVEGVPFVSLYWRNHAGEIQLEGPDGINRDTAKCYGATQRTWCLGWGAWADDPGAFTDGEYTIDVTGFTQPPRWPGGSTRGPYALYVPTAIPSQAAAGGHS